MPVVLGAMPAARFADACRHAREAGRIGIEPADGPDAADEAECRRLAQTAADAGLVIDGLLLETADWSLELTRPDPELHRKDEERVRVALRQATWLGCGSVRISAGAQRPIASVEELRPYENLERQAAESLERLLPEAEDAGVRIELRVPGPGFLLSPTETRGFLDRLNSPAVAACLELAPLVRIGGLAADWIVTLGPRLAAVRTGACLSPAEADLIAVALERAAFTGAVIGGEGPGTKHQGPT